MFQSKRKHTFFTTVACFRRFKRHQLRMFHFPLVPMKNETSYFFPSDGQIGFVMKPSLLGWIFLNFLKSLYMFHFSLVPMDNRTYILVIFSSLPDGQIGSLFKPSLLGWVVLIFFKGIHMFLFSFIPMGNETYIIFIFSPLPYGPNSFVILKELC